jgi:hypothetical protein
MIARCKNCGSTDVFRLVIDSSVAAGSFEPINECTLAMPRPDIFTTVCTRCMSIGDDVPVLYEDVMP